MEMEMQPLIGRDETESSRTYSPCIFRIAHPLLTRKPEAYIPQVISMGPFHHKRSPIYEETETFKHQTMDIMIKKFGFHLDSLVTQIRDIGTEVRAFYDNNFPKSIDFLWSMLVLDASFLLQWLRSYCAIYSADEEEMMQLMGRETILHSKRKTPLWYAIQSDVFMLENQVPLFLLTKLLQLTTPNMSQQDAIRELKEILFVVSSAVNPFPREEQIREYDPLIRNIRHILEFLYLLINPDASLVIGDPLQWISSSATGGSLPSATELVGAGVKFEPCLSGQMRDIHFNRKSSTLRMPKIIIRDSTEVVLRNLVALELYLGTNEKPMAGYTYLMDRLIDTPQDVAVLKRSGILYSQMGSDKAIAEMWNSMCTSIPDNSFGPVNLALEETTKYYRSKWRVLLAECMQVHCSKPWVVLSIISTLLLLILTFIQVFCAFYPCSKKSSNAH